MEASRSVRTELLDDAATDVAWLERNVNAWNQECGDGLQPGKGATDRCDMAKAKAKGNTKARTSHRRKSASTRGGRRWSARVTRESDALDLSKGVFSKRSPKAIARSLKRSAEHSSRRKSEPYRSAMSMLTFYINRAGKNLPASRRRTLDRAKDELRKAFHRD
jgi:hypothetical protein